MGEQFKIGDRLRFVEDYTDIFKTGHIVTVTGHWSSGVDFIDDNGETGGALYSRFELVESKRTKNQRLTTLEETVAKQDETIAKQGEEINELKTIVEGLRKNKFNVEADAETVGQALAETLENVIEFEGAKYRKVERKAQAGDVVIFRENTSRFFTNGKPYKTEDGDNLIDDESDSLTVYFHPYGRTPETVDVYERIMPSTVEEATVQHETLACSAATPKTANELRAETIQKAKDFKATYGAANIEFIVNEEKRTVVVICYNGKHTKTAVATCHPNDVFNADIGGAIALGRLGHLNVSEFEQAVQPDKPVEGMLVKVTYDDVKNEVMRLGKKYGYDTDGIWVCGAGSNYSDHSKIINDTNAIYGGVE